jgi:hypothetical protein
MKKPAIARMLKLAAALTMVLGAGMFASSTAAQTSSILNTKHNLSALTGASTSTNKFTATAAADDEVCVFCHTPHAASAAAGTPPLWNKTLPASISYSLYSSTTMDAARATDGAGGGAIGSVSIACLSCHDGANAMNSVINAPGSGLGTGTIPGTWTTGTGTITGVAKLVEGDPDPGLSNDHPIGIAYCAWSAVTLSGNASTITCGDDDFQKLTGTNNKLKADAFGGTTAFWVETGGNTTRNKSDIILYNRTINGTTGPSVECASCHDPHLDKYADGVTPARTFLRVANTGSSVCLACHVK